MNRAILWLLLGLGLTALLMIALVPGALGNLGEFTGTIGLVLAAGIPGLVVVVVLLAKGRDERDEAAARAQPDRIAPIATTPEWEARHGDAPSDATSRDAPDRSGAAPSPGDDRPHDDAKGS